MDREGGVSQALFQCKGVKGPWKGRDLNKDYSFMGSDLIEIPVQVPNRTFPPDLHVHSWTLQTEFLSCFKIVCCEPGVDRI